MPDVLSSVEGQNWCRFLIFTENYHIGKACQNAKRLIESGLWETFVKGDAKTTVYKY